MEFIKNNKIHLVYLPIIFICVVSVGNQAGQIKGLQDRVLILKNLACSLPEEEFKSTIESLVMPKGLKDMLGDNHSKAWKKIKNDIKSECYE